MENLNRLTRKPRQSDVAKRAGVSTAIVSLVLNGRLEGNVRISQQTQERVWQAIRDLGYVPNPVARSLAGGQNRLLGVFTYEAIFPLEQHDFFYPFLLGIEHEAESQGYDLLLFTQTDASKRRKVFLEGVNRLQLADGAVLLGQYSDRDELARLQQEGFAFVYVGRREVSGAEISYVAADYAAATAEIINRLLDLGHRRLLYLKVPQTSESSQDREAGYRQAFVKRGVKLDESSIVPLEEEADLQPLEGWLARGITAIISERPGLALRIVEAARKLGKQVPRDLSVATLGDVAGAPHLTAELTTFCIPRQEMGAEAVRLLLKRMESPPQTGPYRLLLPCTQTPGSTIGPPRHPKPRPTSQ
ncbi:MAG: LacI family DNA-binding transcriptional regulator [Thermaceae bacterium]|nr:LacI family DNA-binding transcriptional regulator [Thermaceae bacterium]